MGRTTKAKSASNEFEYHRVSTLCCRQLGMPQLHLQQEIHHGQQQQHKIYKA